MVVGARLWSRLVAVVAVIAAVSFRQVIRGQVGLDPAGSAWLLAGTVWRARIMPCLLAAIAVAGWREGAADYSAGMTVWQYAQLRVVHDNRLAPLGGKWTVDWHGPDATRHDVVEGYGAVVAELGRAGARVAWRGRGWPPSAGRASDIAPPSGR